MSDWKTICRVDDIPRLGARRVRAPSGGDVAVFRTAEDQVFALLDRCPHKGGPLSQGIVFGDSVACPLHNWTIGLADGCAAAPDDGCTQRFACRSRTARSRSTWRELAAALRDLAARRRRRSRRGLKRRAPPAPTAASAAA